MLCLGKKGFVLAPPSALKYIILLYPRIPLYYLAQNDDSGSKGTQACAKGLAVVP